MTTLARRPLRGALSAALAATAFASAVLSSSGLASAGSDRAELASVTWALSGSVATAAARQQETGTQEPQAQSFDLTHRAWTEILAEHLRGDRFDYRAVTKDPSALNAYLASLAAVTPKELAQWKESDRFAFFINAYNAYTVSLVASNLPLESIEDLSTEELPVWKRAFIPLGRHLEGAGELLSLDQLEHQILRPRFEDARVHVAVNCASVSCPPLRAEAFRGSELDEQLDDQMARFLADESRNRFDAITHTARLSKIFEWFAADFEREAGSVNAWLALHGPPQHRAWVAAATIVYLDYDWSLNAVPREDGTQR
ncbi:DUF547 domain-containing protein [Engelhardtia mirabilis]|uniref:DUF547 domain-containing protein n=1 Tax=Engelhardtia mirabilis TaxID=2528011 RepID=A0A518BSG4_9BACT|nr:hypothetical protein Pla133_50340 [Planctomycetes bacterium Pla133]QDV04237.1 hypothetical protein Pla86_50320 [Planctomycetes bacterium Pla86]